MCDGEEGIWRGRGIDASQKGFLVEILIGTWDSDVEGRLIVKTEIEKKEGSFEDYDS